MEIADSPPVKKCLGCGNDEHAGRICAACRPDFSLDGAVHGASYRAQWAKRGIHCLKFKGIRQVAPVLSRQTLGQLLAIAPLEQLRKQAVLIPIPLHPSRLRHRGFNQCLDITTAIAVDTAIPIADILIRRRATRPQTKLPHELRTENLARAFTIAANTVPSPIAIIIDDVTTTGSTLNAAAQALKQHGFKQCWGLTIARG